MSISTPKLNILLVEDALDQAVLVGRWLTKYADAHVTLAATSEEALERLRERDFDIMLADIEIPGSNGIDVAKKARELRPHMATALMTAHSSLEYATRAIQSRVADFVVKPLKRESLVNTVLKLAATARQLRAENQRTILAIGAHPDDVEIGCGGILLKHKAAGDRVVVLTLSEGGSGGATEQRKLEATDSAGLLGAELMMANLPDTAIKAESETISTIAEVIAGVNPDVVYTHSSHDTHQDHRAVHYATIVAARGVPNLYCYQSPSATIDFQPMVFIDIGQQLSTKLQLLEAYESQVTKCAYLAPDLIRATARYWGRFAGNRRVEPLEVIRAVGSQRTAV